MASKQCFRVDTTSTPIGVMQIVCDDRGRLRALGWEDHDSWLERYLARSYPEGYELRHAKNPEGLTSAIDAYMAGELDAIRDLPVEAAGTAFQKTVWKELRAIPVGETITYGELARRIGKPSAPRAVGLANGANPVGVVVPCHRVIGADSSLTGYGGGLERKRWLLRHEGCRFRGNSGRLFEL